MIGRSARLFSLLIVCLVSASTAQAHPFHFSSAEMQWNEKSNCFEVAWKVDPHDLEQQLRKQTKRDIVLEKLDSHDVVFAYVNRVFQCEVNGKQAKLKPVGFEVGVKDAWIYFEVPARSGLSDLKIKNEMLLQAPHQTNTVLIKQGKQRLTFSMTEETSTISLKWDAATASYWIVEKVEVE